MFGMFFETQCINSSSFSDSLAPHDGLLQS